MSDPFLERDVPRVPLLIIAFVVTTILVTLAVVRLMGYEPQMEVAAPVLTREIAFRDNADGLTEVYAVKDGEVIEVLPAGGAGFVPGVLRTLVRERNKRDADLDAPYTLARRSDGAVTLEDPLTGTLIDFRAFGHDNLASFARFLGEPEKTAD